MSSESVIPFGEEGLIQKIVEALKNQEKVLTSLGKNLHEYNLPFNIEVRE